MTQDTTQKPNYTVPLIIMTAMFFLIGFITTMSNTLIGFLKDAFKLNETQAMLVNMSVYGAYIVSIPISWLMKKIGYKGGVLLGLAVVAAGYILLFPILGIPASSLGYILFLLTLLIVAIGVVLLQVAANPFVIALGTPETASSRLVLVQSMNSVGTVIAPFFVTSLILTEESKKMGPTAVQIPFLCIAGFTIVVVTLLYFIKLPVVKEEDSSGTSAVPVKSSVWAYKNLVLGTLGIFMYMGVEVGVPSFFVKYSGMVDVTKATNFLMFYWGGMLLGRFAGIFVLKKFDTAKVIALYSVIAALLLGASLATNGMVAIVLILLTGLFHSVLWPSIFNLAITDLGPYTKQASGIICTAVMGGGILLLLQGAVADSIGVKSSMFLLFIYYAYMVFFGLKGSKMR